MKYQTEFKLEFVKRFLVGEGGLTKIASDISPMMDSGPYNPSCSTRACSPSGFIIAPSRPGHKPHDIGHCNNAPE